MKEAYDAVLVTAGVVGLSMASKKVLGEKLTDASSLKDTAKLEVGVAASTMLENGHSIKSIYRLIHLKCNILYR